jgi:hypothetical protein
MTIGRSKGGGDSKPGNCFWLLPTAADAELYFDRNSRDKFECINANSATRPTI